MNANGGLGQPALPSLMSSPTLSIIIPAWNEERYVGRTIDSLKQAAALYEQERGATAEIIVVDNNSAALLLI